jgi:hypothetical protein
MAQTITFRSNILGLAPMTPLSVTKFADVNIAAGAVCSVALPTVQVGAGYYAVAMFKFKAYGTTLTAWQPLFSDAAAGTGNPQFGEAVTTSSLLLTASPVNIIKREHITDIASNLFFCMYASGTLTGTFTVDGRIEIYSIA